MSYKCFLLAGFCLYARRIISLDQLAIACSLFSDGVARGWERGRENLRIEQRYDVISSSSTQWHRSPALPETNRPVSSGRFPLLLFSFVVSLAKNNDVNIYTTSHRLSLLYEHPLFTHLFLETIVLAIHQDKVAKVQTSWHMFMKSS